MNRRGKGEARPTAPEVRSGYASDRVADFGIAALLVARLWTVTEGTAQGETLFLAFLTSLLASVWAYLRWREDRLSIRVDLVDIGVFCIVGGHLLSGLVVLLTEGNGRFAINASLEWLSLGLLWVLLRQRLTDAGQIRRYFDVLLLSSVALACVGLAQHYYWYEVTSRTYESQRAQLDAILEGKSAGGKVPETRANLEAWFAKRGIPTEGRTRELWEQRLLASREPLGRFALANSFASIMLLGCVISVGMTLAIGLAFRSAATPRSQLISTAVVLVLLAWVLLLTKSRTGYVGLAAGLVTLGWHSLRGRLPDRLGRWLIIGCALGAALVGGVILTGGIDTEVLSEAPRSLRYRLQYWTGTAAVIRDEPVFGPGPGNFRAAYLAHKPEESSEEISDPHNWPLDLWVSGGLLAIIGVVVVVVAVSRRGFRSSASSPPDESSARAWSPVFTGGLLGVALPLGWDLLTDADDAVVFGAGLAGAMIFVYVLRNGWVPRIPVMIGPAILFALLVHLFGAGGIEMPAITGLVLFSLAAAVPPLVGSSVADDAATPIGNTDKSGYAFAAISTIAWLLTLLFGLRPVWTAELLMLDAQEAVTIRGNLPQAARLLKAAAAADPFDPTPWRMLGSFYRPDPKATPRRNESRFDAGLGAWRVALARDSRSSSMYSSAADWAEEYVTKTDVEAARDVAREFREASILRYPTHAIEHAKLALLLSREEFGTDAKRDARTAAEVALGLDQISRAEGHRDRFLPDETRNRLQKIVEKDGSDW